MPSDIAVRDGRCFARLLPAMLVVCGFFVQTTATAEEPERPGDGDRCFHCTRVIGYSQVGTSNPTQGARHRGWFVAGGVFESVAGRDHWELLWAGGAGVDRWRDPDYHGWSRPLVSPCRGGTPPDRVLLSISGPYGRDEEAWAAAITDTVHNIRRKIPSAREIILQPVVGAPDAEPCRIPGGGLVRASWQHAHIHNAIRDVVRTFDDDKVRLVEGYAPRVRDCGDYADALGHLRPEAAEAVGRAIAEYYVRRDAECARDGHVRCGKNRR